MPYVVEMAQAGAAWLAVLLGLLYAAFWLGVLCGEKRWVRVWWPGRK